MTGSIGPPGPHRRSVGPDRRAAGRPALVGRRADGYQREHGEFLGDVRSSGARRGSPRTSRLLGPVAGRARARGRRRRRAGLALAAHTQGAAPSPRPVRRAARRRRPARRSYRRRCPVVQADAAALPFAHRRVRPRLLGVRRPAVRRRPGVSAAGGRPRAAARRPVGVLRDPSGPLGVPRRPRRGGLAAVHTYFDRTPYVEVGRGRRRDIRGAAPHARRPGPRCSPRRPGPRRPRRTRVAARTTPRCGARCAVGLPGTRRGASRLGSRRARRGARAEFSRTVCSCGLSGAASSQVRPWPTETSSGTRSG